MFEQQIAFTIPRTAAYIYTEDDLPENFVGYQALLAESSIPLVAIPGHAVTKTTGSNYALIIVAPDSARNDRHWLTPDAREVVSDARLPTIGLYNGGYVLFDDLGQAIGTNVVRTSLMTDTTLFNPSDRAYAKLGGESDTTPEMR